MTRRRIALFVILALAAVTSVWLRWTASPPPPAAPESPLAIPAGATPAPPLVAPAVEARATEGGATVFLRVISAVDQLPLAGASVAVRPRVLLAMHHPPRSGGTGTTDATGTLRFGELPEGELEVSVRLPYFEIHFGPFEPNATVVLKPLPPVRGIVLHSDRTPAPGALISSEGAPVLQTRAGPDGRFTLALASWGFVVGEQQGELGVGVSLDPKSTDGEVEIVLGAGPKRTGRVVGRDGKPLEGVEVELRLGAIVQHQLTGGDGTWAYPGLQDVDATVRFEKRGYLPVEESGFLSSPWQDTVLSRGAQLAGRLVNPDRTPVAGATVEIAGMQPSLRPEPVTTDALGRFAFSGLGFASGVVWATLGERETHLDVELPDGQRHEVTVVLPPELVAVELEVVNENGTGVDSWGAVATPVPDQGWTSHKTGLNELQLCRGRFRIVVTAADERTAEVTVDVEPKPELPPVRVVLPGNGFLPGDGDTSVAHTLQVRVRTPAGEPVEGATVTCLDGFGLTGKDGTTSCEAHTDEESWPLQLIATLGNATGMTRATGQEPLVEIVVRAPRILRGRVVGQLPPSGLRVGYRSSTQNDGVELKGNSFVLENIDPVRTFVCVTHQAEPAPFEVLGCTVAEENDDLVIAVGAPGALELTVLDEQGLPLEAPIFYVDRQRQDEGPAPQGVARLEVPPGTHVLVINVEGRRARYETFVTVRSGEVTRLGTLRLQ